MLDADKDFVSASPVILFRLTKVETIGDEDDFRPSNLTEEELENLSSICRFAPDFYDPEDNLQGARILSYEILYNGIDQVEDLGVEPDLDLDEFDGYPIVAVRFHLDKEVNVWSFYSTVEGSRLYAEPSEVDGWFWEDHNGYSRPISPLSLGDFLSDLDLPMEAKRIPFEE